MFKDTKYGLVTYLWCVPLVGGLSHSQTTFLQLLENWVRVRVPTWWKKVIWAWEYVGIMWHFCACAQVFWSNFYRWNPLVVCMVDWCVPLFSSKIDTLYFVDTISEKRIVRICQGKKIGEAKFKQAASIALHPSWEAHRVKIWTIYLHASELWPRPHPAFVRSCT